MRAPSARRPLARRTGPNAEPGAWLSAANAAEVIAKQVDRGPSLDDRACLALAADRCLSASEADWNRDLEADAGRTRSAVLGTDDCFEIDVAERGSELLR